VPRRQKSLHPLWKRWGPQLPLFSRATMQRLRKKGTAGETTSQVGSGTILGDLDSDRIFGATGERPSIDPHQLNLTFGEAYASRQDLR
jgi:hypothetical protein